MKLFSAILLMLAITANATKMIIETRDGENLTRKVSTVKDRFLRNPLLIKIARDFINSQDYGWDEGSVDFQTHNKAVPAVEGDLKIISQKIVNGVVTEMEVRIYAKAMTGEVDFNNPEALLEGEHPGFCDVILEKFDGTNEFEANYALCEFDGFAHGEQEFEN